ncbi:MAG: VWA domain-containing protein [Polyangiales bacterium]
MRTTKRRAVWMLVGLGMLGLSPGCSVLTRRSSQGSILSVDTAATVARSYRLDEGYFFGHDVRPLESVVYVLDLSGSMSGRSGSALARFSSGQAASALSTFGRPLGRAGKAAGGAVLSMDKKVELVKDHLNASLRGLRAGAKFNVVLFSDKVETLSPSMIGANAATTAAVGAFVAKLGEGGGTSLQAAIDAALATDAHDIIVLTDGLPTDANPEQILSMVASRNPNHARRIYTVGVGDDQAAKFLTRLAEDNGGAYLAYR